MLDQTGIFVQRLYHKKTPRVALVANQEATVATQAA